MFTTKQFIVDQEGKPVNFDQLLLRRKNLKTQIEYLQTQLDSLNKVVDDIQTELPNDIPVDVVAEFASVDQVAAVGTQIKK